MKSLKIQLLLFILTTSVAAQNYDESKVPDYSLPEILKTADGKKIKNKKTWESTRRPEIVSLFEDNIYGHMPKAYDSIDFKIINQQSQAMGGKATLKETDIMVWKTGKQVVIHLVLFIPNNLKSSASVFLLINNRSRDNADPSRKDKSDFWPAEMLVDSGYAIAAFHVSDAAPDDKVNYTKGVLQLYPEQLDADNGMKAIGAWAWAAGRVMDYFEKERPVDPKKVAVVGHSRGGKAALWAGAQDQRFAMVISNCSGNTGAALARRRFGERIKVINTSFPHWFSNNYKKYNDNEDALPVDQHMLIAVIAPRPVYVTSATEDLWADPKGSYLALKNAEVAYNLYKKQPALPASPPAVNQQQIIGKLGYHNREGIHNLTAFDWSNFIRFAKLQWGR
jgi:hypothetical protein